jgi:hypothetical protein
MSIEDVQAGEDITDMAAGAPGAGAVIDLVVPLGILDLDRLEHVSELTRQSVSEIAAAAVRSYLQAVFTHLQFVASQATATASVVTVQEDAPSTAAELRITQTPVASAA